MCPRCASSHYPLDDRLGRTGFVSPQAPKRLGLAGASWSFAAAAGHLAEFCGLRTCDQTIRRVGYEEAGLLADGQHTDPAAGAGFAAAGGDRAFQTDGTLVNTGAGGHAMRRGGFAKRQRGRPAKAAAWDSRRLPRPPARVLFGGIETAKPFGPRLRRGAGRLGIADAGAGSVLADGAAGIGPQSAVPLPGSPGLLDISHASEHRAGCAQALYGEGAQAQAWGDRGRQALLTKGAAGVQAHLRASRAAGRSGAKRKVLDDVARSFGRQAAPLGYAGRWASGQSIGSGLVEGACKQGIGRRMKQTGARWRVRRANRRATRCCPFHGDLWASYWEHRLN